MMSLHKPRVAGPPLSRSEVSPRLGIHAVGSWIEPHQQTGKVDYRCQINQRESSVCLHLEGKLNSESVQMSKGQFLLLKTQRRGKVVSNEGLVEGENTGVAR